MAVSLQDLLYRLRSQTDSLNSAGFVSPPALEEAWWRLSQVSLRALALTPDPDPDPDTGQASQRLALILGTVPPAAGPARAVGTTTGLLDLATTIGCMGDLLATVRPTVSDTTRSAAARALEAGIESTLSAAARWTLQRTALAGQPSNADRQLRRLADRPQTPAPPPLALAAWRLIGSTDLGLDGAVARWAGTAHASIDDPRAVSQLALQLATGGIALICHTAADQIGHFDDNEAVGTIRHAAHLWGHAADWPADVRLGGRSAELRDASHDLRRTISSLAGTADPTHPPAATGSGVSEWEIANSALQGALAVGNAVSATLHHLAFGPGRAWVESHQAIPLMTSVAERLTAAGLFWVPEPGGMHALRPLHRAASEAQDTLTGATIALLSGDEPRHGVGTIASGDPPWETVEPTFNPNVHDWGPTIGVDLSPAPGLAP